MSALRLRIDKYVEGDIAPEVYARIHLLNESGAERAPGHPPLTELIPVSHRPEDARTIKLQPGRYYIETVLPSGEILADSVSLAGGSPQELVLRAEDSPHEWLSWQHLLGNLQTDEAAGQRTELGGARRPQGVGAGRASDKLSPEEAPGRGPGRRSMRLYVGNLPFHTSSEELEKLFSRAGRVESAEVVEDRDTRHARSFGFVEMATEEEAHAAISQFDSSEVGGRTLTVQQVRAREYRGRGPGRATPRPAAAGPAQPPREVNVKRPIQWLSHPHAALVSGEEGGGHVWGWLAGLSLTTPKLLTRQLNAGHDPLDIPPDASDGMRAVFRVSWSQASGGAAQPLGNRVGPAPRYFVVVPRRRSVELVSLPMPWNVVTTDREADIELAVREPAQANDFCTAAAARDERLGMLLGYLSSGSLPVARRMAETAKEMLYYKFKNPFAAAAGAYALVGTARRASDEDWHQWVSNLMNKFPHIPDGAIQWGQLKLRMRRDSTDMEHARNAFKLAYRRGLPFYSTGMRWLMDGLEWAARDDEEAAGMLKNVRQLAWRTHYQQPFTILRVGGGRGV